MTDVRHTGAQLHWPAIWRAAVTTMTFALPLAVLQTWLAETDRIGTGGKFFLNLVIMSTGALGGFAAAKLAASSPFQNGAAAAALAAVIIQVGGDIRHAIVGEDLAGPFAWIFLALLMATFGMFGAWVNEKTKPSQIGSTPR